jgi:flagellar FliJ protein
MAFKFKLEKVLDYRKQLEEQAMQALAEVRRAEEKEKERLAGLRLELAVQRTSLNASIHDAAERWLVSSYINALTGDIRTTERVLEILAEEIVIRQAALVEKAQEKQLLDKLKDKQALRHAQEEKLKEQRDNDETATIRYKKKTV